ATDIPGKVVIFSGKLRALGGERLADFPFENIAGCFAIIDQAALDTVYAGLLGFVYRHDGLYWPRICLWRYRLIAVTAGTEQEKYAGQQHSAALNRARYWKRCALLKCHKASARCW